MTAETVRTPLGPQQRVRGRGRRFLLWVVVSVLGGLVLAAIGVAQIAGSGVPYGEARVLPPRAPAESAQTVALVNYNGVALPVSTVHGPRQSGPRASGFAHSQEGAALAAMHLVARVSAQVGPDVYGPTLSQQAVGDVAGALRVADAQFEAVGPQQFAVSVRGWRVDAYDGEVARVSELVEFYNEGVRQEAAFSIDVQWLEELQDWVLVVPPGGAFEVSAPFGEYRSLTDL